MKDQRLTVNVTIDEAEQLAELARSLDRSVAWVIRQAVLAYLASPSER